MKKIICNVVMVLIACIFIYPILATIVLSFLTDGRITFQAWKDLLFDCFIFYPMFWNSVGYSVVITLMQLCIVIPGTFGLLMVKGKRWLFGIYLVLMMLPLQVTLLPNYIGLRDLHLLNTRMCIILPMAFSVSGVVIMHQYMEKMDLSQIEAARLETDSILTILWQIVIPQMKIGIFAAAVFTFIESYNMLEQPMLFLNDVRLQNLTVFIANAKEYEGAVLFPSAVVFMIPVLILYMWFHDSLQKELVFRDRKK